jgi:hypothetical protein
MGMAVADADGVGVRTGEPNRATDTVVDPVEDTVVDTVALTVAIIV